MAKKDSPGGQGGGLKSLILAILVTCLAGAGIGFGAGTVIVAEKDPKDTAESASASAGEAHEEKAGEAGEAEEEPPAKAVLVPLPPMLANLAEPKDVWIRLEGGVLVSAESEEKPDVVAARCAEHILAYLRTLKLKDLDGAPAFGALARDLDEIVKSVGEGEARGFLASGLVVE